MIFLFPIWAFFAGVLVGAGLMGLLVNAWLWRVVPEADYKELD